MKKYPYYRKIAGDLIDKSKIPQKALDRASQPVRKLLKDDYCVDVHTHFFDMKCINEAYFMLRNLKDFLHIRGEDESGEKALENLIYSQVDSHKEDWNEKLSNVLEAEESKRGGVSGILTKLLWMKKMKDVYEYYLDDASLASYFSYPKENVITSVLMMDFRHGWGVNMSKSISEQIEELFQMQKDYPVLPFLFCDPRRADEIDEENLYYLFNKAFANEHPFFGVKIYPSLGYDPNDFRLWPIYEICEDLGIPIITHCGGPRVSHDKPELTIYQGEEAVEMKCKNRIELGCELTNPDRWIPVMKKFNKLKLDIAHFGSNSTWDPEDKKADKCEKDQKRKETIFGLMETYPNVYSDFSYTITHKKASENFIEMINKVKKIRERSMFGSDYWVVFDKGSLEKNQKIFLDMVKEKGDDDCVEELCISNPTRFLFGKL